MIKPTRECPFCGDKDIEIHSDVFSGCQRWYVHCTNCMANGPSAVGCDDAIEFWDEREPEYESPQDMGWVGQDGLP